MHLFHHLLVLSLALSTALAEDFYQLLGVSRQANAREIRKAFKKLALEKHPDKNKDDPDANELFVKINRAYEVLKDEELRKKYDMYGEEGLKEDGPSGRSYQSWNFYQQDFGIYDDDPEIITLNKADFEQSVENTQDVWFINFYSPRCSHCHDLAPSWREVARELEGVIRIGAVNCGDDWQLCRSVGIHGYPSLIIFPARERFQGMKDTETLVKFALRYVGARVVDLYSGNFQAELDREDHREKPWLITYCGDGGDCLETSTSVKLAAMLTDLVTVGAVDCHSNTKLCNKMGVDHGTHFYDAGHVEKGRGIEITSLVAREVAMVVLRQLPDVTEIGADDLQKKLKELKSARGQPWLVHFVEGQVDDLELRKLPVLLTTIKVARLDCKLHRTYCNNLHIHKFPTFAVFKAGGGHEIHHGRQTAHDIAAFARDSAETPVRVMGPEDFPAATKSQEPWFIDFYAPWCPPCMRLLPEFRKASKQMDKVHFGTVDCTIHTNLCNQYQVQSYPTTVLYNQTVPHRFHGHHHVRDIVEFLQDTLRPPVVILNPTSFDELVGHKAEDSIWVVDFYAPWCGPCQQLAPEWRQLAKMTKDNVKINVGQVDCDAHKSLCTAQKVTSYPNIRLYPPGKSGSKTYHVYNQWFRDAHSIHAWIYQYLPSKVVSLNQQKFSEILKSTEPWIIDFFAPWCGHCQVFAPEFELVAQAMEGRVKAGKVDCDQNQHLCRQAGIRGYPTIRFYGGSPGNNLQQSVYGDEINSQNAAQIIQFLNRRAPKISGKKSKTHDEL